MHYKGIGVEGRLSSIIQHFYSVFFYRSKGGRCTTSVLFPDCYHLLIDTDDERQ